MFLNRARGLVSRIVCGCSLLAALSLAAHGAALRPADDTLVLLKLPPAWVALSQRLRQSSASLRENPQDLNLAVSVAREAIDQGRANADPRAYGQAQAALATWWNDADPPPDVRVLRAVIRQAGHDFKGAMADLDAVLAERPNDAQARLTRAFVRMVMMNPPTREARAG